MHAHKGAKGWKGKDAWAWSYQEYPRESPVAPRSMSNEFPLHPSWGGRGHTRQVEVVGVRRRVVLEHQEEVDLQVGQNVEVQPNVKRTKNCKSHLRKALRDAAWDTQE